ncbi:hypothetical protein [Moorena sp. SIO3H5]|uniref:hypothetical protein n=1 Tax=Moorena sp. SIO3H5 TaxID=2607834 RepID=UPI0013B91A0B|nr:hypothetical protein [Moorena sp. SIO3H5]NEO74412.1 hypothetical protein [Moorena sp. SIO3H5]
MPTLLLLIRRISNLEQASWLLPIFSGGQDAHSTPIDPKNQQRPFSDYPLGKEPLFRTIWFDAILFFFRFGYVYF